MNRIVDKNLIEVSWWDNNRIVIRVKLVDDAGEIIELELAGATPLTLVRELQMAMHESTIFWRDQKKAELEAKND